MRRTTEERVECGEVPCREDFERGNGGGTQTQLLFYLFAFLGGLFVQPKIFRFCRLCRRFVSNALLSTILFIYRLGMPLCSEGLTPMILGCFYQRSADKL